MNSLLLSDICGPELERVANPYIIERANELLLEGAQLKTSHVKIMRNEVEDLLGKDDPVAKICDVVAKRHSLQIMKDGGLTVSLGTARMQVRREGARGQEVLLHDLTYFTRPVPHPS